ncbi:MAG: elongation factor G [Limisphaerales bacterium]|jgi:elongation factor G
MKFYDSNHIKNVALFGHQGSGKTTLTETMLYEAGAISRRGTVDDKNTISDYNSIEQERGNSLFSCLMHLDWRDTKINIIDTPGFDDFVGEIHSALKVVDIGIMVLNAQYGVEVGTELTWDYATSLNKSIIIAVNQLDTEKSDYDNTVEQLKSLFGNKIIQIQYPLNQGDEFDSIIDVLRMTMYKFGPDGGKPKKLPIPESEQAKADQLHNELVEAAAENDEGLMELYFEKGSLDEAELQKGLQVAMQKAQIYPVFCVSAKYNMGSGRMMGFIHDVCPSPPDLADANSESGKSISPDPNAEIILQVYKTISEPHLGDMSFFKVYSGTLKAGADLLNTSNGSSERISQLFATNGRNREQVDQLAAGDLGATVKLKNTHTNNTLTIKGSELKVEKIQFPTPRIRSAITAIEKGDEDKLGVGLHQIAEEDPTYKIEYSQELHQTIIHAQGELHLGILKQKLEERYKIKTQWLRPKIPFRETIQKASRASYRHKKQSGGSGQFGEVSILVEPWFEGMPDPQGLNKRNSQEIQLAWGGKLVFNWCIVGGAIDAKFATAIMKGIMEKMENGPLTGSYVRDIRVSVYDGKMHAVDSNDMAFKLAATMAFKQAFREADPKIMEPIFDVTIKTPPEMSGDIMSDLQTRRAQIQGMDTDADGHNQIIIAKVPLIELFKYSSTLRSLTQGRAKHSRAFAEYSQVPFELQQELISENSDALEQA